MASIRFQSTCVYVIYTYVTRWLAVVHWHLWLVDFLSGIFIYIKCSSLMSVGCTVTHRHVYAVCLLYLVDFLVPEALTINEAVPWKTT